MDHGMKMILLTEIIREEEGKYIAFCRELGLATCGKSFEEARKRIEESTGLVLNAATRKGEINALLKEKRIRIYNVGELVTHRRLAVRSESWITSHAHEIALGVA